MDLRYNLFQLNWGRRSVDQFFCEAIHQLSSLFVPLFPSSVSQASVQGSSDQQLQVLSLDCVQILKMQERARKCQLVLIIFMPIKPLLAPYSVETV